MKLKINARPISISVAAALISSMLLIGTASAQTLFPNSSPSSYYGSSYGYGGYGSMNAWNQVNYCANQSTNTATTYPQLMQLAACWQLLQRVPLWYWLGGSGSGYVGGYYY